jgi:beta-phosphoglucomutase-like phosphatase (HAD superfamily)
MLNDYKAILFGSIGTLVETSEIQRKAFNQAFSEAGLDWIWAPDEYNTMLKKSGGINRINDYATFRGIGVNAHELHTRKTEIFDNMMNEETTTLRPGVDNLISYAIDNDIRLGFVTSTSEANIDAIFMSLNGQIKRSDFNFIGNDKIISQPKPNSEIYLKALSELNLSEDECIAIEDTEVSMRSAIHANLKCIAFPGALAHDNNFSNAHLVTYDLSPNLLFENQI